MQVRGCRNALNMAKGGIEGLQRLAQMLPPPTQRMAADWLHVHGGQMMEEYKAAEYTAAEVEAVHVTSLRVRFEAKQALRAASRHQLQSAVRKVGFALRAASIRGDVKALLSEMAAHSASERRSISRSADLT
jgi:hypothetical protein